MTPPRPARVREAETVWLPTRKILIEVTESVVDDLKELAATGLYGFNAAEAAERLIARYCQQAIADGLIRRRAGRRGR